MKPSNSDVRLPSSALRGAITPRTALACGILIFVLTFGCRDGESGDAAPVTDPGRAVVSDDGTTITFPAGSPGLRQMLTAVAKKGTTTLPVIAPARIVASIVRGASPGETIILFDSPDATALYSQHRQSRAAAEKASRNLERVKDMFNNQAATARDLAEAQADFATASASKAEYEGKLRALGFNPAELRTAAPGTVWLISDVTEEQLHDVVKGERVGITFTSYPGRILNGRAEAIGAIVDPATRTAKVRVTMPNPKGEFLPGMFARIDFGNNVSGVIILPASAVVTVEGKDYVFVASREGVFRRLPVTLIASTATDVVLGSGVESGDSVVTSGAILLKGLSFGY